MFVNDELGTRIKNNYENIPKIKLMRRCPVIIRIDGRAFHTFAKGFNRPFDDILIKSMQQTMQYLCENIQGCVLGYTQSDEITLVLQDYKKLTSDAWFDYEVEKICSISASMTTLEFNRRFSENFEDWFKSVNTFEAGRDTEKFEINNNLVIAYEKALNKGAMFDSRCFNVPFEEVTNVLYWRQLDATRNSIQMVGQYYFSDKKLHNKSCNMIQEMLWSEKNVNWNDFPTYKKRGSCCIKIIDESKTPNRTKWVIDTDIPIFVRDGREYVESRIRFNESE